MTREKAIEYWEGLRKTFSGQLEKEENHFGRMHLQTTIDAIDMAISALRQQESVTKCHDLYDEDGGEVLPKNERNDPMTLDELRKMDGEPVWTVTIGVSGSGRWELCTCETVCTCPLHKVLRCVTADGEVTDYDLYTYGKTWLAYRQKPEEGTV